MTESFLSSTSDAPRSYSGEQNISHSNEMEISTTTTHNNNRWPWLLAEVLVSTAGPVLTNEGRQTQLYTGRSSVVTVITKDIFTTNSGIKVSDDFEPNPLVVHAILVSSVIGIMLSALSAILTQRNNMRTMSVSGYFLILSLCHVLANIMSILVPVVSDSLCKLSATLVFLSNVTSGCIVAAINVMQAGVMSLPFKASIYWSHKRVNLSALTIVCINILVCCCVFYLLEYDPITCVPETVQVGTVLQSIYEVLVMVVLLASGGVTLNRMIYAKYNASQLGQNVYDHWRKTINRFKAVAMSVGIGFLICKLPMNTVVYIEIITGLRIDILWNISGVLYIIYNIMPFFLLVSTNRPFRKDLLELFSCRCCR